MRIIHLLLLVFLFPAALSAQHSDSSPDTLLHSKIMVIPYNPYMHLSDADDDIAEYSEKNKAEIRAQFRQGLLQELNRQLLPTYQTFGSRNYVGTDEQQDLETIYSMIDYRMDTVYTDLYPAKDTVKLKEKLFGTNKTKPNKEKRKYMNVRLSRPELLAQYSKKYGTDLYIFLNQFDIKTNYNNCYDLALKIYEREIKVHYSVFDATGKQVYGDAATVYFPSNANDVDVIIAKNFPALSEYIYKRIPPKEIIPANTASN
jgi:hypothetical protein